MKNRFWVMTIITLITLSGVVRGSEPIQLIMGSEDFVREYWATNTTLAKVWIGQNDQNGLPEDLAWLGGSIRPRPTNYTELLQRVQNAAVKLAEYGITNKDVSFDLNEPFFICVSTAATQSYPESTQSEFFFFRWFSYEKVGDKYTVPASVGEITLPLNDTPVIARIPGIEWAKIIVTDLNGQVIDGFDGFLDPDSYGKLIFPDDDDLLRMKLEYVLFEGKPIRVEVYLMENGRYHSFLNGVEQPWKQPRLGISPILGGIQITVTGDPNQTFSLEVSNDLKTWENIAVGFIPYRNSWKWTDTSALPSRFYRISHLLSTVEQKKKMIEAYKVSLKLTVLGR